MTTYRIIRFHRDDPCAPALHVIKTGLTLEQAEDHCARCERRYTARLGDRLPSWWDGYDVDNNRPEEN